MLGKYTTNHPYLRYGLSYSIDINGKISPERRRLFQRIVLSDHLAETGNNQFRIGFVDRVLWM